MSLDKLHDPVLPLDVLIDVVELLHNDPQTLLSLCLTNQALLSAAAKYLYAYLQVPVPPRYHQKFQSALLPCYSPFVRYLKVICPWSSNINNLKKTLLTMMSEGATFPNLVSIEMIPSGFVDSSDSVNANDWIDLLRQLLEHYSSFCELQLHRVPHCTEMVMVAQQASGLRKLTIGGYNTTTLGLISAPRSHDGNLSGDFLVSLEELNFIDPLRDTAWSSKALSSFMPQLQNVRRLTLGPVSSDVDELSILCRLPNLKELVIRYDAHSSNTIYNPKRHHPAFHLQSLTVIQTLVSSSSTRSKNNQLCQWIIKIVTFSSLQHLHIVNYSLWDSCEDFGYWMRGFLRARKNANASYDAIIDHLVEKHSTSLQTLYLGYGFIRQKMFVLICKNLKSLRELTFAADPSLLRIFNRSVSRMEWLHSVQIELRNVGKELSVDATSLMKGCPRLGRLQIDRQLYEKLLAFDSNGEPVYSVKETYLLGARGWDTHPQPSYPSGLKDDYVDSDYDYTDSDSPYSDLEGVGWGANADW
ncbi:hypothetical protein D9758_016683 [Tetrapyrgos nigripes]|uniref:F-box domain-containing protein n=1 Tax=Tetrapyrgos nigripes TaxID=182062 RepID=A0A8H5CA72_9AGAR|nr:hypothetical protein D9758_016683 [Tetrapyrgos nigripes]